MEYVRPSIALSLAIAASLGSVRPALAQTATVTLSSQKQYIRGFGGMVHIPWAGDLSAAERTLAFGTGDGQLGFTVLRIAVPDGSTSTSSYVATAKAVIAAGGIVYATPWNSSGAMNSSDFATYADHLSSFVTYMKGQGAELFAIGTQNEPDYGSQGGWRTWTAAQCHDFMLNYGDKVGTKLITCESFNYAKGLTDPILNDSAALEKMGVLGTHLYGTSTNNYAYPLFDSKAAGKERWMTEHYTDSNTDANAWPNALGVASELHNAMVTGQFNAYTWWYIKRSYGPISTSGAVTKRGWCMAHWSKFVRPGFYRVDATASPASGVSLSAFKSDTDVVLVAVNTSSSTQSITVSINGSTISSYDKFTTSSSKSFASDGKVTASNGSVTLSLDASSVTTLHGSGTITGAGGSSGSGGSMGTGGVMGAGGATGGTSPDASVAKDGGADSGRDGAGDTGGPGSGGVLGGGGSSNRDGAIGSGGAPGSGGTVSAGGTSGSGGVLGSGGTAGSGGSSVNTGSGAAGSGGTSANGGSADRGGSSGSGGSATAVDVPANGCNCAVGGLPTRSASDVAALILVAVGLIFRRRQRVLRRKSTT